MASKALPFNAYRIVQFLEISDEWGLGKKFPGYPIEHLPR